MDRMEKIIPNHVYFGDIVEYDEVNKYAEGGMSTIYTAIDSFGNKVILKDYSNLSVIDEDDNTTSDTYNKNKLFKEYQTEIYNFLVNADDDIKAIFAKYYGLFDYQYHFVKSMEYLEGLNLEDYLNSNSLDSEKRDLIIDKLFEIVITLDHYGITLVDFKPSNMILIPKEGNDFSLKIIDYDDMLLKPNIKESPDSDRLIRKIIPQSLVFSEECCSPEILSISRKIEKGKSYDDRHNNWLELNNYITPKSDQFTLALFILKLFIGRDDSSVKKKNIALKAIFDKYYNLDKYKNFSDFDYFNQMTFKMLSKYYEDRPDINDYYNAWIYREYPDKIPSIETDEIVEDDTSDTIDEEISEPEEVLEDISSSIWSIYVNNNLISKEKNTDVIREIKDYVNSNINFGNIYFDDIEISISLSFANPNVKYEILHPTDYMKNKNSYSIFIENNDYAEFKIIYYDSIYQVKIVYEKEVN